jgi:adenylate cyclase
MLKKYYKSLLEVIEKKGLSGVIIAIVSFIFIMLFSFTEFYETFELRLYDVRFNLKPSVNEWNDLKFLDINEQSITNIGKYPWPRHYYASALAVLKGIGARQVTFDMEFPDPSPKEVDLNTLNKLRIKAEKKNRIDADELKKVILDNDNVFAEGVKGFHRVILPYHFQKDIIEYYDTNEENMEEIRNAKELFNKVASILVPKEKLKDYSSLSDPHIKDMALPIPKLINAAYKFGFTDSEVDVDGVARKKRLIRFFQDRIYFDLGLVMLMDLCGVEKENIEINIEKNITLKNAVNPVTFIKKDIVIPIDAKGRMLINWAGPGPYTQSFKPHIPFDAILEYADIKKEIHDFFDEQEISSGSKERSQFYGELERNYKEFTVAADLNYKRKIRKNINEISGKIVKIEQGYASVITKEIQQIEGKLKNNKNRDLESNLNQYKNYLKGINIVLSVESLRDKNCIAGLVATGTQDIGATPTDNEYWMVGTYHNIVNTILNESFIKKISQLMNLLIIIILTLIMGIGVQRLNARKSLFSIAAALIVINIINIGVFTLFNIWFDQLGANLAVFLPSFIIAGMKLMKEEGQKRYEKIIESPKALELGGEEQTISIFFSDIAKFSTISEKLTPPELVQLLNEYLSEMTNIILSHNGTVDKYIGDAIMAFYGAPLPYEDHARRCCMAAIDMKRKLMEMQDSWREQNIY